MKKTRDHTPAPLRQHLRALAEAVRQARWRNYEPQAVEQNYLVKVNKQEARGA